MAKLAYPSPGELGHDGQRDTFWPSARLEIASESRGLANIKYQRVDIRRLKVNFRAVITDAIDAHVHVWTNDRRQHPRLDGAKEYAPDEFTPDTFLAHARPCGVTRAVLVQMSFYGNDNSYMLDAMQAHKGVFSGIGIVNSDALQPEQTMVRLAQRGVRGFRITPGNKRQTWLDTPGMRAMWQAGARHGLALCPLINPAEVESIDRMCSRFPDTTVVVDHLARIGVDGAIRDADVRQLCRLAQWPNAFVKVSAFYALGKKQPPYSDLASTIQHVFENYGPRRLMWASDCPFQLQEGHTYEDSIGLVRDRLTFLSDDDRAWLLARTAESVFFHPTKA